MRVEYLEKLQVGAEQNMQSPRDLPDGILDTESDFFNVEDDFDGEYDITRTTRSAGPSPSSPPTELELEFARTVTTETCNKHEVKEEPPERARFERKGTKRTHEQILGRDSDPTTQGM